MREKKFTEGPWAIMNQGAIWLIYGFAAERVARIMIMLNGGERRANAALISAAPELLEALENFEGLFDNPIARRRYGDDKLYAEAIKDMKYAIAKAYGE